jgi:hypothetical protein
VVLDKITNTKFKKLEKLHQTVQMARDAAISAKNQIEKVEGILEREKKKTPKPRRTL